MFSPLIRGLGLPALLLMGGCSSIMMDSDYPTQLLSVSPQDGAAGISTRPEIVMGFSRSMMAGMEQYVALHRDGTNGPRLGMSCGWSDDRRTLTCQPGEPLAAGARYTIHVGGGMMDADGKNIGMSGGVMGGRWATAGMMGNATSMMGPGWQRSNGSYGMVWDFTTR